MTTDLPWEEKYHREKLLNSRIMHILYGFREILTDDVCASLNKRKSDQIIKAFVERIDEVYKEYARLKGA